MLLFLLLRFISYPSKKLLEIFILIGTIAMAIYHTTVDAYHKWKRNGGITNHNNVVNILNSIPNRRYQCMTIGLEHVHSLSHDELGLIFDLVVILTIEYKWVPSTSLNNFQYVIISLKSDNFINSLYQGTLWTVFDLDHKKKYLSIRW